MLFLTYWKLNEDIPMEERHRITREVMESGDFPPDGITIVRWDTTPDGWGITVVEAESAAAITRTLALWRMRCPGFFEVTKTAPAQPVREALDDLAEALGQQQVARPA